MARILVVEDERALRYLVCERLESGGHEVLRAASARTAVKMAATHRPDLLLFDRKLADNHNGLDVFRVVRATLPDLIGIVMTQYGSEEYALRCRHNGVAEYITKPFGMDELMVIVTGVLAMHEPRGPMPPELAAELHAALGLQPAHASPAPAVERLLAALDTVAESGSQESAEADRRHVLHTVLDVLVVPSLSIPCSWHAEWSSSGCTGCAAS